MKKIGKLDVILEFYKKSSICSLYFSTNKWLVSLVVRNIILFLTKLYFFLFLVFFLERESLNFGIKRELSLTLTSTQIIDADSDIKNDRS